MLAPQVYSPKLLGWGKAGSRGRPWTWCWPPRMGWAGLGGGELLCSGPCCPEARKEAEQEGGGQGLGAALGGPGPSARPALPGRGVAQVGLAAGHGDQGALCHPGDGFTLVSTPHRVAGQRARCWGGGGERASHPGRLDWDEVPQGRMPACRSPVSPSEMRVLQKGWLWRQLCVWLQRSCWCRFWQE